MIVGRRQTMTGLAAALLGAAAGPGSLREAGRLAGLRIGSSSEIDLRRDPAYAALIRREADLFAPNMSWQRMSPQPGVAFEELDPNIAWAREAGLPLTGYHLLWHQRLPDWFERLDRAAAERAIVDHIRTIASRFGPATWSWNVINEAIRPADGLAGGLRRSPLIAKFGTSVFDLAFEIARASAPAVIRVYNDYDLELATPADEDRRTALLRLLDELARRAVPINAIGLQSHLRTRSFEQFDPGVYRRFLDELAARGLDLLITELDVQDQAAGSVATRDAAVADVYRRFLEIVLAQKRLRALTFWGLSDRYSWLNERSRPNYLRGDGQLGRVLPFDAELQPKAAAGIISSALAQRGR